MKKLAYLVSVSALLFACRSDEGGVTPGGADAPPAVGSTKVSDVQGTGVALDAAVTLKGVVVTAIDKFGTRTGNVFVADPAGGPFSGVLVVGASAVQVDALAVGDIVTVDGAKKTEFALTADMSGRTTTELVAATGGMLTITKTGAGTVPAPAVVDAQAIAALDEAGRTAEWEKWEGVLIKVVNVAAQTAPRAIGGSMPDPTFQDFGITGGIKVDSSQAAFPDVLAGDCLASVWWAAVPAAQRKRLAPPHAKTVSTMTSTVSKTAPTTHASLIQRQPVALLPLWLMCKPGLPPAL
jgi:hypothetical protein